jgi:dihydroneopterin aldolase
MGIIRLHNMSFYAYHGLSSAEKETGRRYEVDCELHLDLDEAGRTERLNKTVNYAQVYEKVENIVKNKRFSLIEAIAAEICDELMKYELLEKVVVRVRKKMPPIPGNLDHIEVEIERTRE